MPSSRRNNRRLHATRYRRVFLEQLEGRSLLAATITVNSAAETNLRDSELTLREAILINNRTLTISELTAAEQSQINGAPTNSDSDTIAFNIPGAGIKTISPTTALPAITDAVLVDGYTQPGTSPNTNTASSGLGLNTVLGIELNGSRLPFGAGLEMVANNCTIRGLAINGFIFYGILLTSGENTIEGNFIGMDSTGTMPSRNAEGIRVLSSSPSEASNNRIGGTAPQSRNLISGNNWGIVLVPVDAPITGTLVQGNLIGTDISGMMARGNARHGVMLQASQSISTTPARTFGNTVGGSSPEARNIISGNGVGVDIESHGINEVTDNLVQGNYIGLSADGSTPVGNVTAGVEIRSTAARNVITQNRIAFNGYEGASGWVGGVLVYESSTHNAILANSIFLNHGLGIDLGGNGLTPNDTTDSDSGSNELQNFPEISRALLTGGVLQVTYSVPSGPGNADFPLRIEFFSSDIDGQEGQTFLGFDTFTLADFAAGSKSVNITPVNHVAGFDVLVATATDSSPNGSPASTSEFSTPTTIESFDGSLVVTNTSDLGSGSLRAAILASNLRPGFDTITFNIPGTGVHTIRPRSVLPSITDPVIIDGYSQPGAKENDRIQGNNANLLIELSGDLAEFHTPGFKGLHITSGGSTVRGLIFNRFGTTFQAAFSAFAIVIDGNGDNVIAGNFLGIDSSGLNGSANLGGVLIEGSSDNLIGGSTPEARNVISANKTAGVRIHSVSGGPPASNNVIQGNYIGVDRNGTAALGNLGNGVEIVGASHNTVGGKENGGNVISGNGGDGIALNADVAASSSEPQDNVVAGNIIGLDATGSVALGNEQSGVTVASKSSEALRNRIGGLTPGDRNIISGNQRGGIRISGNENIVSGNFIGPDITGTKTAQSVLPLSGWVGNAFAGLLISGGSGNIVGGASSGARNIISGNSLGVAIRSSSESLPTVAASSNVIVGNYIGTDVSGAGALANASYGIWIWGASQNVIGGQEAEARNVISANAWDGIHISGGYYNAKADANVIQGNSIGTDASGMLDLGNGRSGVVIENDLFGANSSASGNLVGGTTAGAANFIAFNTEAGVVVGRFISDLANANAVVGNSIFQNRGPGIDLDFSGQMINDAHDADSGPNNLQNHPVISYAFGSAGRFRVRYTVPSHPGNASYPLRVEFFRADTSGQQGKTLIAFDTFTVADFAAGEKLVSLSTTVDLAAHEVIVATATDSTAAHGLANTSAFSAPRFLTPWFNPVSFGDVDDDGYVAPSDALTVINYLNAFGPQRVPDAAIDIPPFIDTNGDNNVAADDALGVINYINAFGHGTQGAAGEGESNSNNGVAESKDLELLGDEVFDLLAVDVFLNTRRPAVRRA